jgi:hypothetical protein
MPKSNRRPSNWMPIVTLIALAGCGSGSRASDPSQPDGGSILAGATPCEKAQSLAARIGCSNVAACMIDKCQAEAIAWLECAARDPAQCMCESDGRANCEGSFKPDEGPAKCIAEHDTFERCFAP